MVHSRGGVYHYRTLYQNAVSKRYTVAELNTPPPCPVYDSAALEKPYLFFFVLFSCCFFSEKNLGFFFVLFFFVMFSSTILLLFVLCIYLLLVGGLVGEQPPRV
jgi:hypothetical protein